MKRRTFLSASLAGVGAAVLTKGAKAQTATPRQNATAENIEPGNPFKTEGNWYKAALHVHTTTSDGDVDVATRIKQYRDAGFDVVAITDHWKTNDISGYSDDKFVAISGMEMHPKTGTGAPGHHFVTLDLPHPLVLDRKQPAQEMINTIKSHGGMVIYAHPYWTAHSIIEMQEVEGYIAMEVYNGLCEHNYSKGFNQSFADQLFNRNRLVGLIATDDIHNSSLLGLGWTMIRAKNLDKASIMAALKKGDYYASCGPVIEDFKVENNAASVKCSPAAEIRFHFNGTGGGNRHRAEKGQTRTTATWKFSAKRIPKWVYCEVIDAEGNHAWTNPIRL